MKKLKHIFTSLLSIIMCFSVFKTITFAETTPTYFNTTHFQMTQSHENFNIVNSSGSNTTSGATFTVNHLVFNTKNNNPYTGILTLNYSYSSTNANQNLANWEILCNGCIISSYTNTSGVLKIKTFGNTTFSVDLVYRVNSIGSGLANPFTFSSMTESSVSAVTDPIETDVNSIDTKLTTTNSTLTIIQGKIDTANANLSSIITNTNDIETFLNQHDNGQYYDTDIETLLSGCKTELNGIYNYTTLNEALLNNIAGSIGSLSSVTNGETIVSCINSIKNSQTQLVTNTNNIYSALSTISTNQNTIISSLSSMGADLSSIATTIASVNTTSANIYSAIISMKTTLEGYEQYIDNIEGLITDQNNLINNLDNKLDTITWNNKTWTPSYYDTSYNSISGYVSANTNFLIDITNLVGADISGNSKLYKIVLPVGFSSTNFNFYGKINSLKLVYSNAGTYDVDFYYYNTRTTGNNIVIYLNYSPKYIFANSSFKVYLNIQLDKEVNIRVEQADAYYMYDTDIEYWNLLTYFNQYQTNKKILEGLLIDVDTETSIVQYNRNQETVTQIENDLTTLFNQTKPYVDSQLAPLDNETLFTKLRKGRSLFDYIFRGVWNTNSSVTVPNTVNNPIFLIIIFAGVFLAIVG